MTSERSMIDLDYLASYVERLAGKEGVRRRVTTEDEAPLDVLVFRDMPDEGCITAVTLGLSTTNHPGCAELRPELLLCVKSEDIAWALAAGNVARVFRGRGPFEPGDTIDCKTPHAADSEMTAFFVFNASILEPDEARVEVPGGIIQLYQLFPLYPGELEAVRQQGPRWLLDQEYDLYDVARQDLSR